jgi:hypothetical protein
MRRLRAERKGIHVDPLMAPCQQSGSELRIATRYRLEVAGDRLLAASPPDLVSGGIGVAGGLRGTQVFRGKLYVANNGAAEVFASSAPSASPGSWQQVNSTGFVASGGEVDGQGNPLNGAIWQLGVFDDYLYAGTTNLEGAELWDARLGTTDRDRQGGADLWRTQDGVAWEPVNLDGFGDRDNYGIRNMLATPWGLMIGTGNAIDGFEIWLQPR